MNCPERITAIFLAVIIGIVTFLGISRGRSLSEGTRLRAAIDICEHDDTTKGLLTGYNFYLLERYSRHIPVDADIVIAGKGCNYLDSLKAGKIDIVAVPVKGIRPDKDIMYTHPLDSISVWAIARKDMSRLPGINRWIDRYHDSPRYDSVRTMFMHTYDPIRRARSGRKSKVISPYDAIVRECADSLGWDWRLICAIMYQESRFCIDAVSKKGAVGLMQVMPATAEFIGAGDTISPEANIKAGCAILGRLYGRYVFYAANREERIKLTIAAYNAGAGRITEAIAYADSTGRRNGKWEDLASVFPIMRENFSGTETIRYVDRILELYDAFKTITE